MIPVRFKAGAVHLAISGLIALLAIGLIFGIWYPGATAYAQGVDKLVLVMIAVDVALGPLITTIIYNPSKRAWLRFDLAVVALLQISALVYALYSIHGGRPAYMVFHGARFDLVPIAEVDLQSAHRAPEAMRPSFWGPKTVAALQPEDPKIRSDILFQALEGGADLPQLPEYFVPLAHQRDTLVGRLRPLSELRELNELDEAAWRELVGEFGGDESVIGYLPVVGNARDGAVIINRDRGEILGLRLLNPAIN